MAILAIGGVFGAPASAAQVGPVTVTVTPSTASATASYTVAFTATSALSAGSGTVTLDASSAPTGTAFPAAAGSYVVTNLTRAANSGTVTAAPTRSNSNATVTIVVPKKVFAGDSLSITVSGATNPPTPTASKTLSVSTSSDTTPRVSTGYAITPSADGSGSVAVSPTSVMAGAATTLGFTYTAASGGMLNGRIDIAVPSGWSAPSTTAGAPGYTTASTGSVAASGQTISVTGVTLSSGGTMAITYGAGGGTASAVSPNAVGASVFTTTQRSSAQGTMTALASSPVVNTTSSPDGSGTVSATPASAVAGTPLSITFTYTAAAGGMSNGAVTLAVPNEWTAPSATSGAPGHTTTSAGTLSISGRSITVSGVTLPTNGTVAITYSSAQASRAGLSTFPAQQRSTTAGTLTALAAAPTVGVEQPTLLLDPGAVTTVAGNGTSATVDGTGASASFSTMGGNAVVDGFAYVATLGVVRKVDLATGQVTTLAGSAQTGCTDGTGSQARYSGYQAHAASDGVYLYTSESLCGTRRTSLATGQVTTLVSNVSGVLSMGLDGFLYIGTGADLKRLDVATPGAQPTTVVTFPPAAAPNYTEVIVYGVAVDRQHAWVVTQSRLSDWNWRVDLRRVTLADGTWVEREPEDVLARPIVSAGNYLYQLAPHGIRRIDKATGAWAVVAGAGAPGWADGTATDGWFSNASGLSADGSRLIVSDDGNRRLRVVTPAAALPSQQQASATTTLTIDQASVTALAGSGLDLTADGEGLAASFKAMGGVAIVGDHAYVSTSGAIRKVHLSTGVVTTLAGNPTPTTECTDAPTGAAARFRVGGAYLATDGYYLYLSEASCGVRRVSLASGATSTIAPGYQGDHLAVGPDGFLYLTADSQVQRIDRVTGRKTVVATFPPAAPGYNVIAVDGLTVDATHVWAVTKSPTNCCNSLTELRKVALTGPQAGVVETVASAADTGAIYSAGSYLYQATPHRVRRISKADGAWTDVAGTASVGYANGTGTDAWFKLPRGMATDGTKLVLTDGNLRLRVLTAGSTLPSALPAVANTNLDLGPAAVTTVAGNGFTETVDGNGLGASFSTMGGMVVVNGFGYVHTAGSIRRVDLATGDVETLAGHPTEVFVNNDCRDGADSSDPTRARFHVASTLVTDGYYLYANESCGIRRTSIATGATSTITPGRRWSHLAYAPDGYLYAATDHEVIRVDRVTGQSSTWFTFPPAAPGYTSKGVFGLTADSTHLWALTVSPINCCTDVRQLRKIPFANPTLNGMVTVAEDMQTGSIVSAGDYLYQGLQQTIRRYSKADGTWTTIAGDGVAGWIDSAEGASAEFDQIRTLATDGTWLWVVDGNLNRSVRVVAPVPVAVPGGPDLGFDSYGMADGEDVNGALGNFVTAATDLSVATPGPELQVSRAYNSLDPRSGPLGVGWTFGYDMRAERTPSDSVTIVFPDGRRESHKQVLPGVYVAPRGYFSKVQNASGGGWTLTEKDGTVYAFASTGKLTSIADENGRSLALAYGSDGKLHTATAANGRTLEFEWTGPRITAVSTDAVAVHGGRLTWRYYYVNDLLDRVCDPRNNASNGSCTSYMWSPKKKLTKIVNPKGNTKTEVAYLANGKVDWRKNGEGNITDLSYPAARVAHFTNGRNHKMIREYDSFNRLVKETDHLGHVTTYGYTNGNRDRVTDANSNTSTMTFDTRGNLTSVTDGEGKTQHMGYDERDNKLFASDARSANAQDAAYATTYDYDPKSNMRRETTPATPDFPQGTSKRWTYTDGTEPAVGGGITPPGLIKTETDQRDKVSSRTYTSRGDLAEVFDAVGLRTVCTHDELGRKTSETMYSDAYPGGVTTTYAYTVLSQLAEATGPVVAGVAGGPAHQRRTTNVYDPNGNRIEVHDEDLVGGDATRVTTYAYDNADREKSVTDAEQGVMSREYDAAGNVVKVVDQEGRETVSEYDARNLMTKATLKNFVDDPVGGTTPRDMVMAEYTYDPAKRRVTEKDSLGRVTTLVYDKADRPTKIIRNGYGNRLGGTRDIVVGERVYNAAGHVTRELTGNGTQRVDKAYDAAGRVASSTLDPDSLNRTTTYTYDAAGNTTKEILSDASRTDETRFAYDDGGRRVSVTVENGANDLVSTFGYDQRGNEVWTVDGRGNASGNPEAFKTAKAYDELSRLVRTTSPAVSVEQGGGAPTTAQPFAEQGYSAFGEVVRERDERGNVTTYALDKLGRRTGATHPVYVTPGGSAITPTETFWYDKVGNLTAHAGRRGGRTDYTFDKRNRVVRQQDPQIAGEARGESRFTYDDAGNRLSAVDQIGARAEWTYDGLNRVRTEIQFVRQATGAPAQYTTTFDYDDRGNPVYLQNPTGAVTTQAWSPANELLSTTDPALETTAHAYDVAGRRIRTTDPLGRVSELSIDPAGRVASAIRKAPNGGTLTTTSFGYDNAGNRTSVTSARGFTSTFGFDAASRLTSVVQPVDASRSITASYGYDAASNLTRVTDGRGNTTVRTFTSWNLPEETIEPSTASHPSPEDRTWRTTYDAGGLPVVEGQPGGVVVTRTFDELSRLRTESGAGSGVVAGTRTLGWDLAGRQTRAGHPDGDIVIARDDRGLVTGVSHPAAASSFTYDAAGRMLTRTDAAGTATFTWTPRSELETATDPLTNTTRTYLWNDAGQLREVSHGTGGAVRTYSYDDAGRVSEQRLARPDGSTAEREVYGYDADDNVTSVLVELAGNAAAGQHSYGYDRAGRLSSWTKPDATVLSYGWDDSGNRTSAGGQTFAYDQRNRLLSGPEGANSWTARGTLASTTSDGVAKTFTYDGLGRMVDYNGEVSYSYDSLGRVARRGTQAFAYGGLEIDPVADGSSVFSRSPGGDLLALSAAGGPASIVGRNRHGDVTHLYNAAGVVTGTRLYDPFGDELASTGVAPVVGYQGDWTDAATGKVWMGARWYDPESAVFDSRDTVFGELASPVSLNRYTYAFGDPMQYFDPDGHWPKFVDNLYNKAKEKAGQAIGFVGDVIHEGVEFVASVTPEPLKSAAASLGRTVEKQVQRVQHKAARARQVIADGARKAGTWVQENKKLIARFVATTVVGVAVFAGCTASTMGFGAPACAVAAGAAAGAVNAAFDCPGKPAAECAKGMVVGAVVGGAAGAMLPGAGIVGAIGGGFAVGVGSSAITQFLMEGEVDWGEAFTSGLVGSATGGFMKGAARVRGGKSSSGSAKGKARPAVCSANSFTGDTPVLMADGSSKPIRDVAVGDLVLASDPEIGVAGPRPVTHLIRHGGDHAMVDVTLSDGTVIKATNQHPFWDASERRFEHAEDLDLGDQVSVADGRLLAVAALRAYDEDVMAYNLTVADLHTYYAGSTPVLVHNTNGDCLGDSAPQAIGPPGDPAATGLRISAQRQAGHVAGTPQHANRIKQGVPTSVWEPGAHVDGLTRYAWQHGTPVPGRPNVRELDFGFPVGSGPSGGWQSRVRVHMDQQARIHGHPAGPEYPW